MASSFGGTIKLQGESEYKKALSNITDQLRLLSSEMKLTASDFSKGENAMQTMQNRSKVLNSQIDQQVQKIIGLSDAVRMSSEAYGENDKRTISWKAKLNEAKAELNNLNRSLDENEQNMNAYAEATEEASNSSSRLGDIIKGQLISEVIVGGIKSLASAMARVGSALIGIGKQAVSAYGEYEQMTGGIEAMFSGIENGAEIIANVMGVADNAWQSLNMSQNDYYSAFMSTYPLMKNDIEDVNEAIEVTNQMLQLESDLANTFGYDMSYASTAINWALKGTYSYLDNLNLGITGTKTGFLEAAHNVGYMVDSVDELTSAEKLDIIQQYADRYAVLGRTASESAGTIQGSMKAVSATWENLLTGITNEDVDFSTLVDGFVQSVLGASSNLLPRITQAFSGIGSLIGGLAGALLTNLPTLIETGKSMLSNIASGISSAIPTIIPIVKELASSIWIFIKQQSSSLLQSGMSMISTIGEGLAEGIPDLIDKSLDMVQEFADFLAENAPTLIQTGISFVRNLIQGLVSALPELINRVPIMISQFANVINDNAPTVLLAGVGLIWDIIKGLISAIPDLVANIPQIISAIIDVWQAVNWVQLGTNIVTAIGNGINNMISYATTAITNIKNGIITFIKDLPTTLLNIGKQGISGLGNGITSMVSFAKDAIINLGTTLLTNLKGILSWDNLKSIGNNIAKGLWQGISDMTGWVLGKVKSFGSSIVNGLKDFLGIHSPSRVFRDQIGKNMALGVGEGFTDTMKDVSKDISRSIPIKYELGVVKPKSELMSNDQVVAQVVKAFKGMKVELNDREVGSFVIDTVGKVAYS